MLTPERTLAIICGASEWPNFQHIEKSKAFERTASEIRKYLSDASGLAIPKKNLLWLFDVDSSVKQYDLIGGLIEQRLADFGEPDGKNVAIIFVYVGHGSFFGTPREYCLMVRDTRRVIESDTSLRVSTLAAILKDRAPYSSRILILDSCFAGAGAKLFQGPVDQAVGASVHTVLDSQGADRGVALLCASSSSDKALLEADASGTAFGKELLRVLRAGDGNVDGPLTLRQLCDSVRRGLQAKNTDYADPEVHVPIQHGGDLASIGLFPNPAVGQVARSQVPKLYDSDGHPETFRRDWNYFSTDLNFSESHFTNMPGVACLSTAVDGDVGMNLPVQAVGGFVDVEYLAQEGHGNLYFCVIPMIGDKYYVHEFGGSGRNDPRNRTSPHRVRFYIPPEHCGDDKWHRVRLEFDFRNLKADYAIFAPRINEGVQQKAAGKLYVRNVQVYGMRAP
jgi:hypothetical protein